MIYRNVKLKRYYRRNLDSTFSSTKKDFSFFSQFLDVISSVHTAKELRKYLRKYIRRCDVSSRLRLSYR